MPAIAVEEPKLSSCVGTVANSCAMWRARRGAHEPRKRGKWRGGGELPVLKPSPLPIQTSTLSSRDMGGGGGLAPPRAMTAHLAPYSRHAFWQQQEIGDSGGRICCLSRGAPGGSTGGPGHFWLAHGASTTARRTLQATTGVVGDISPPKAARRKKQLRAQNGEGAGLKPASCFRRCM